MKSRVARTICARWIATWRDFIVGDEIEVALAIALLNILKAVPLLGQRRSAFESR